RLADIELHIANDRICEARLGDIDAVEFGITPAFREPPQEVASYESRATEYHRLSRRHHAGSPSTRPPHSALFNINRHLSQEQSGGRLMLLLYHERQKFGI